MQQYSRQDPFTQMNQQMQSFGGFSGNSPFESDFFQNNSMGGMGNNMMMSMDNNMMSMGSMGNNMMMNMDNNMMMMNGFEPMDRMNNFSDSNM